MKTSTRPLVSLMLVLTLTAIAPAADANVVLGGGADRSICPDPTFNACYIGVDGGRTATTTFTSTFSFVGLGVNSGELGLVTFPAAPPSGVPDGRLTVGFGTSITVNGAFDPARPFDSSVFVGLGNGSRGTLTVSGGTVETPLLSIGEQDARVSTGAVLVSNGGRITTTLNSGPTGPSPGQTSIGIGRGAGSSGSLLVTGQASTVQASGASVSLGRSGTGDLSVQAGASFTTAGSIYASAGDPAGRSIIGVEGIGSLLTASNILLGVAADPASGNQLNQGYLTQSPNHGLATLLVRNGGTVASSVVVGAGGTVRGDGSIVGNVSVYGGTISPGNSPGTLHINGNYLMDGGTYLVEVGGTAPGLTDRLDITGSASLANATILFSFINGFAPSAGFTFDFLDAAGGLTFSNLTFATQGLQPGFAFGTSTVGNAFVFTARSNGLAVPEPGTMALLFAGLFGVGAAGRRGKAGARGSMKGRVARCDGPGRATATDARSGGYRSVGHRWVHRRHPDD